MQQQPRVPGLGSIAASAIVSLGVVVGLLSGVAASFAQSSATCGPPRARAFDFWVGRWNIRQKILQEDGTYLELPAQTDVSLALDGCALIEQWEGEVQFYWEGMREAESMKALSVRAYDPRAGQWYIYWMDTRSRNFDAPYVGGFADGKGEFYREWETADGKRVGRITFSDISPSSVDWRLDVSSDGRRSWTTIWAMEMERAGK